MKNRKLTERERAEVETGRRLVRPDSPLSPSMKEAVGAVTLLRMIDPDNALFTQGD